MDKKKDTAKNKARTVEMPQVKKPKDDKREVKTK